MAGRWVLLVLLVLPPSSGCSGDECLPACAGRECGADGCGGSCGSCDDGLFCNGLETCQAGICQEGTAVQCDSPGDACRESVCDEESQACREQSLPDGTACDDGDPCSEDDRCRDGACVAGSDGCPDPVVILMYFAADNDLDEWMQDNWRAMESARVDEFPWLRVFVLMDRSPLADWQDTRLYELSNGASTELAGPRLGLTLEGEEELNLGDGATLTAFIRDVKAVAGPDAGYFLLLLDHGDGWWKGPRPPAVRGCCYDESSGDDYLSQAELSLAVRDEGISLIGFDACLQGMAEVAYQHRYDAAWLIASQELEGGWGWDYATLLSSFGRSNDASPENFARLSVDSYLELSLFNDDEGATLAVYDLAGMDALATAAREMAAALTTLSMDDFNALCEELFWYGCEWGECEEYTDLVHLAELAGSIDPGNAAAYQAVMAAVSEVVVYERHGDLRPHAHGMNVFYACYYYPFEEYRDNSWAIDTGWGEMVNAH